MPSKQKFFACREPKPYFLHWEKDQDLQDCTTRTFGVIDLFVIYKQINQILYVAIFLVHDLHISTMRHTIACMKGHANANGGIIPPLLDFGPSISAT